jgi:ligand-binding SRPBCC domain-containing protein
MSIAGEFKLMRQFKFVRQQHFNVTLEKAWEFISNPYNLAKITPPAMGFKVISSPPSVIVNNLQIRYRVNILGLPMSWESLIRDVNVPYSFVDLQLKGPYRYWHHQHSLSSDAKGVTMHDEITYEIGYGIFDGVLNKWIVENQLNTIFDYRKAMLDQMLRL